MALNTFDSIKKAITRTRFQRDTLFVSGIISTEDKEVLANIYNQLIAIYKSYLAIQLQQVAINNIKVKNYEVLQ